MNAVLRSALGAGLPTLLAALAGCSQRSDSASHFPLEGGHRWAYDVSTEWENNTTERTQQVMTTEGRDSLAGGAPAWRRRSDSGVDYWLRSDASGVYRVASKHDNQAEPVMDAASNPRYVLKQPLAVGTSWQAATTAYLLKRNAEFPPEIRHSHAPVAMTYRIEAVGQTITTRGGDFTDCVRVRGEAQMRLFADPVVGFKDMPLVTTEWYCAGVGLVRLERNEPTNGSTFLNGGKLVMELTEWQ
jgi:hypothetical protein